MTRPAERRDSYRLHLDPGQATVNLPTQDSAIELRDLSASGGRLIVRAAGLELPPLPPIRIALGDGISVDAKLDIVRIRSHQRGVFHLGVRWAGLSRDGVHKLSCFAARESQLRSSDPARLLDQPQVTVKSPVFIRNLLGQRPETNPQLMAVVEGYLRLGGQLRVDSVAFERGRRVIRATFCDDPRQLSASRPYRFVMNGPAVVTVFESHCLEQTGAEVTLTLPEEVQQSGSRESPRIDITDSPACSASVSFTHERLERTQVFGEIIDAANRGLSFRVANACHGLFPGDRLCNFVVRLPKQTISVHAAVRSIVDRVGGGTACGVELVSFASNDDAEVWRRFVFDCMHPNLIDGNGHAEDAWGLLEASKYVDLWTPSDAREHVRREYIQAWQDASKEVGHSLLLYSQDTPIGLSAGTLMFTGTWLLHHLARDARGDGEDAQAPLRQASELISGILNRVKAETSLEYFLIYIERGKRWNERLYSDFADRYFDQEKLSLTPNDVFRRSTSLPLDSEASAGVEVEPQNRALIDLLAQRLSTTASPLEREAMALDPQRLDLTDFSRSCARAGHERARQIYFARAAGEPRAALIAESGSEGVNIFGLVNNCQIIALGDQPVSEAVQAALLRQAVVHYRAIGKQTFLFFGQPDQDTTVTNRLGFERVSGGLRWIAHRDVLPAWAAYLDALLAAAAGTPPKPPVAMGAETATPPPVKASLVVSPPVAFGTQDPGRPAASARAPEVLQANNPQPTFAN